MQVSPSSIAVEPIRRLALSVQKWAVGQLLDVRVGTRDSSGTIRLTVAGTELRAATNLPLRSGDQLTVRVTQKTPYVVLTPTQPEISIGKETLRAALSQSLPKQQSVATLLNDLKAHLKPSNLPGPTIASKSLSDNPSRVAAQALLKAVPTQAQLTEPSRLTRVLQQSGLVMEHNLSRNPTIPPTRDLKWLMLGLQRALEAPVTRERFESTTGNGPQLKSTPTPQLLSSFTPGPAKTSSAVVTANLQDVTATEMKRPPPSAADSLLRQIDSAISKIETQQFRAASAALDASTYLPFEIPVSRQERIESVNVALYKDPEHPDENGNSPRETQAMIEIPLEDGVTLRATVAVVDESMSIKLWSDDESLRAMIYRKKDEFAAQLQRIGLNHATVNVVPLAPHDRRDPTENLIDTIA